MMTRMRLPLLLLALVLVQWTADVGAYNSQRPAASTAPSDRRAAFFGIATASASLLGLVCAPTSVLAKDVDPALKGTKADPAYQACMSISLYDCTKAKGGEQKSRAECIPECKAKCATSKEQLMVGTPLKKE